LTQLDVKLLGRMTCFLPDGQRLNLSTRKSEALLAYLAMSPGVYHPRERLVNLFWSDRGEDQARNSLRQALSSLKKLLDAQLPDLLEVERTTVRLKTENIVVDVNTFRLLASESEIEKLVEAVDLHSGEFLEGMAIRDPAGEHWLTDERQNLKRVYVDLLGRLGQLQFDTSDYKSAIVSAECLVSVDPLEESGWRLLMMANQGNGNRNHALMAYKRCCDILQKELGVEPEVETSELQQYIVTGQLNTAQPAVTQIESVPGSGEVSSETGLGEMVGTPAIPEVDETHNIAVLPFDNLSGDPEQEYFSDGITESIIINLSLFPGLLVKSRNSSFAFKQQIKSLGEISKELNVDYVVEGSIRKSDERIRITVQLIEAQSGNQVWGNRYECDLSNLFVLEEELSRTIAATVTGQIESDLQRIAIAKGAAGHKSYDLLLSGTYYTCRFNRQDTVLAIEKLNQCLTQDADNVRAHVLLYVCHAMDYLGRWTLDHQGSFKLAGIHILKALALDPDSGFVQTFYAEYLNFNGKLNEAAHHLDKALATNPNDPDALAIKAYNLIVQGDFETALQTAENALQLDPYHPWSEWELAGAQYFLGDYESALETIRKFRTSPGFTQVYVVAANIKLGRIDLARQALQTFFLECEETMLSMPQTIEEWLEYLGESYVFTDAQINQDLIDCMVQAGLEDYLTPDSNGVIEVSEHVSSIAILPFDNLSGDPEQEYFSDGITESIILNLSLFPGLNVKSRNSSFAFKQQIKSLGEISKELNVDYVVEGSIRKSSDRIRITVQLIEADSGNQIWGKRYDSDLSDLFELEESLSRSIAATVTGQIESDLQRIAVAKGAAHQQSYDLLLQGIYLCKKNTALDMAIAIEKLHQCLELDSGNALAHATLFGCHEMNWIDRWVVDFEASRKLCKEHASKALALKPELVSVQVAYAEFLIFNRGYDEAETHLKRALEINPNDSEAIAVMALKLSCQGKFEEALEQARLALQLDPYHTWAQWIRCESQFFCGLYDEVLATIADTGNPPGFMQVNKIAANIRLGRLEAARDTLKSFLQHCRESMLSMPRTIDEWRAYTRDYAPFADPALNDQLIDCMLQAGLEEEMATAQASADPEALPSILVLPFENLSGDPEQEYVSNGMTESIILNLNSFQGLAVKSRHASFAFKDSVMSIDEIAQKLDVQFVVEGSVRKRGQQIRTTVQLADTASGNQIWGKRFDTPMDDLLDLEEELVQTIAGAISGRIDHELRVTAVQKTASSMKSYDYLMRGWYHAERFNPEDYELSIQYIKKCVELDPDNDQAHAILAGIINVLLYENWTTDREATRKEANYHINRALEIDRSNALAHAFMSEHQMLRHNHKKALFHAEKAIEHNPALPDGYSTKAYLLSTAREHEEAIKLAEFSLQMDPYHFYMAWNAGIVYRNAGEYQNSIDALRSLPYPSPGIYAELAASLIGNGEVEEAREEMDRFKKLGREQMPQYPTTVEAWRVFWRDVSGYQYDEDFECFFDLMMKAGLCDDIIQDSAELLPSD